MRRARACFVFGLLALIPGAAMFIYLWIGLQPGDDDVALAPLVTIPLDQIAEHSPFSTQLSIPDTARWRRIRKVWGEPEFVVFAASRGSSGFSYDLSELQITVTVSQNGHPVPTRWADMPYGYSAKSIVRPVGFRAAPGSELLLVISGSGQSQLPHGQLIVRGDWPSVKDKLVGASIDEAIRPVITPIAAPLTILGLALLALAAYFKPRIALLQGSTRAGG